MKAYFENLLGNEETKVRIAKSIENGVLPHALLIGGPSGSGKSTYALEICAALNCEEKNNAASALPCRNCANCRRIYDGNFPDIKILSKPKDKATLGVEAVKDFREDMFLSATESEYKIYIIDDAEAMTAEAQNALLKILEEPPNRVIIILLAKECDRILTTIKSRVQYVPMMRFPDDELRRLVISSIPEAKRMSVEDPEGLAGIIMSADGRLGYAAKLLDPQKAAESRELRDETLKIIRALEGRALYSDIYNATSLFPTKRAELSDALERLILAIRDLIAVKFAKNTKLLFFTSRESAEESAKEFTTKKLLAIYDAVSAAHELCAKNANISGIIAMLRSSLKSIRTR